jgi:predicted ATPase
MPLAIEIAAGRVNSFGVAELASRLDDRLRLLMRGRRTALTRHQTLHATLEWSYQLLSETERRTVRGLAMFAAIFTWNAAAAVLRESYSGADEVLDSVTNLIAKSLVSASVEKGVSFYRLLDTTRAHALLKIAESGEKNDLARRHAQHYLTALTQAELEWRRAPAVDWVAKHRHLIDNVRAALDWAFSLSGDVEIGVALAAGGSAALVSVVAHTRVLRENGIRAFRAASSS